MNVVELFFITYMVFYILFLICALFIIPFLMELIKKKGFEDKLPAGLIWFIGFVMSGIFVLILYMGAKHPGNAWLVPLHVVLMYILQMLVDIKLVKKIWKARIHKIERELKEDLDSDGKVG